MTSFWSGTHPAAERPCRG